MFLITNQILCDKVYNCSYNISDLSPFELTILFFTVTSLFLKGSTSYFKYIYVIIIHILCDKVHNSSINFSDLSPLELRIFLKKYYFLLFLLYYPPPKHFGGGYRNSLRPSDLPSFRPSVLPSDIFVRSISLKVFELST